MSPKLFQNLPECIQSEILHDIFCASASIGQGVDNRSSSDF